MPSSPSTLIQKFRFLVEHLLAQLSYVYFVDPDPDAVLCLEDARRVGQRIKPRYSPQF